MAHNYLHKKKPGVGTTKQRVFVRSMPDETVHTAPGAMYAIGGLGILAGLASNCWQMITTFIAFWSIFNPSGTPVDVQKQPAIFAICALIAFSFQFALIMLTFRLDTTWKKHRIVGSGPATAQAGTGQTLKSTAIEIVQHVTLALAWGALGFIVDTIGDYTFIEIYTARLDPMTQVFVIFVYAVGLYALSTIAFVRSIEYVWAGFAAAHNLQQQSRNQD